MINFIIPEFNYITHVPAITIFISFNFIVFCRNSVKRKTFKSYRFAII